MLTEGEGPGVTLRAQARREPAAVELAGEQHDAGPGADEVERRARVVSRIRGLRGNDRWRDSDGQVDGSNAIVRRIGDEEVARAIAGDTVRDAQLGAGRGAAVAAEARDAGAGDGGDDSRRDPADAEVALVRDEEVANGVDGDTVRDAELGADGGAAVAAEARDAGAGDCGDEPGAGLHPADAEVTLVRDEEVAHGVDGGVVREVQ